MHLLWLNFTVSSESNVFLPSVSILSMCPSSHASFTVLFVFVIGTTPLFANQPVTENKTVQWFVASLVLLQYPTFSSSPVMGRTSPQFTSCGTEGVTLVICQGHCCLYRQVLETSSRWTYTVLTSPVHVLLLFFVFPVGMRVHSQVEKAKVKKKILKQ